MRDRVDLDIVKQFMRAVPFNGVLGIELVELSDGFCRMKVPFREELIGDPVRPALHGGVISAVIDACGGAAVWTQIHAGDVLSTIDIRVDYLRPGQPRDFFVDARVLRLGNRVGVADMVAFHEDAEDEPIASGKGSYSVKRAAT